jgi:dihydropyrimidinase
MEEVDDGLLYNYFRVLGATGAIPCVHCENMEIYFTLSKELKENGSDGLSAWDEARPSWAEAESIFRAVFLASKAKCPKIYIVHLSSEAGLEMIRTLRKMNLGIEIIVETCPHYLVLDVDCEAGILAKVNPPVRKKSDCEALWQAIQNDEIQTIGADHCVRTISNKGTSIWEGLPGFIGTGFLLQIILEYGYHQRNISLVALSKLMSENPAKIFGVYPQKGSISIGSDADFVLIDLNKKEKISATNCGSIGDYSVFEGFEVTGVPVRTILRGKTVMENRTIYRNRTNGRYIKAKL